MASVARLPGSFRDPSGFVFSRQGVVHRQIAPSYAPQYERLISSGLYEELVRGELLLPHEELDVRLAFSSEAYKVLRPAQLPFISYPFEWCFSQLQDAAMTTLRIQRAALNRGMTLKDASAYNVQLFAARPVLIDTLSFDFYRAGTPWVAYRQFCQHFLAPLALMSRTDIRLGQLFRTYIDGVPLDLASRLLPFRTRFGLGLGLHVHAHAKVQQQYSNQPPSDETRHSRGLSLKALQSLVTHLEQTVAGLKPPTQQTEWADYYDANNNYGRDGRDAKEQVVRSLLADHPPDTVWDLGANDGRFSRLAREVGASSVVAWDIDPNCVDTSYRQVIASRERGHFPLLLDLTNPSPAIGWAHRERLSLAERGPVDVVLALGLIHHLAISNNVPLSHVAGYFRTLTRRLVIEWVPKEDSQVQKLLATRPDIFPDYVQTKFEADFTRQFRILQKVAVEGTCRTMYLLEALPG